MSGRLPAPITQTEVGQIKSYADAVAANPQFHAIEVQWDFWIISTELEQHGDP